MRKTVLAGATALALACSLSAAPPASAQKLPGRAAGAVTVTPVDPPPACPVLSFSVHTRTNSVNRVNTLFNVTNLGPGTASNMKVTGITCTGGFAYTPMPGLLILPFTIPTVPTLGHGSTVGGFNGFFTRPGGGSTGAPFSCTITSSNGPKGQCVGSKVVQLP